MGLKEKISNIINNVWSRQPPSTKLEQPMDGGNNFIIQRELEARIDNMLSSIDVSNSELEGMVYDEYYLMFFQKNYFVNLFDIKTEDCEFRKCWNIFVELCFWFGEASIINQGIKGIEDTKSLTPVYIRQKRHNAIGDIEPDFTYYYGAPIIPMMGSNNFDKDKPNEWGLETIKHTGDEFVYGKWNTQAYGAWIWMYKFVKFQRNLMFLTHNSAYLQKEILYYKSNNEDTTSEEIKQVYNPKSNIIVVKGLNWEKDGQLENRWMVETPSGEKTMTINDVYDFHIQKYYELFGRKMNVDDKKERNISLEVNASQEQFDTLINETRKYMEMALEECKKKFGVEAEFLNDYKEEQENKNMIANQLASDANNGDFDPKKNGSSNKQKTK